MNETNIRIGKFKSKMVYKIFTSRILSIKLETDQFKCIERKDVTTKFCKAEI